MAWRRDVSWQVPNSYIFSIASYCHGVHIVYRIAQNSGGGKLWRIESHSPIFYPAKIIYIVLNCSSTWINFCACASDESAKIGKGVHRSVKHDLQDPWGLLAS